jgi:pyridoxamine 5'-phosphate oxidase
VPYKLSIKPGISQLRKEYTLSSLNKRNTASDPLDQFRLWFDEALNAGIEMPDAMTLATVSSDHVPSARIVLLKDIEQGGFVFYTNFLSRKGVQLQHSPWAALVFFWPALERQVRIEGRVVRIDEHKASEYFQERPRESQVSAIISPQSQPIPSRKYLEELRDYFLSANPVEQLVRPANWGGYVVMPQRIEFWQGRESRLHDRIQYLLVDGKWHKERLAP